MLIKVYISTPPFDIIAKQTSDCGTATIHIPNKIAIAEPANRNHIQPFACRNPKRCASTTEKDNQSTHALIATYQKLPHHPKDVCRNPRRLFLSSSSHKSIPATSRLRPIAFEIPPEYTSAETPH